MSDFRRLGHARRKVRRLIQQYMDDAGLSQSELARRTGMSDQSISATLKGVRHINKVLQALRGPKSRGRDTELYRGI